MNKTYNVLVVDDDADDQLMIKMALEQISDQYTIQLASNGREALACIEATQIVPNLILLDLNMPVVDGFELLHQLKQSALYRYIPTVILTTSDNKTDIEKAYDLGANSFVTKPSTHQGLNRLVQNLHEYWFHIVTIPSPFS